MILHDAMTPTNINTPTPENELRAEPITVPKAQQTISTAVCVPPDTTQEISTSAAIQETAAPRAAGGNLIMQGTEERPVPAVPMQQSQAVPQIITPVSTMKPA